MKFSEKNTDWLLHPITKEDFIDNYLEKKYLHISNDSRGREYYSSLLSRGKLDLFLNEQSVKYPNIKLVGVDDDFKHSDYTDNEGNIQVSKLYKYYSEGATINVNGLHQYLLDLKELCQSLTKETSHKYQTNIYCTPKNSQGFITHYDSHDVIVLQVHGTKEWEIYDDPVKLPLKGIEEFEKGMQLNPTLKKTLTLKEGELLYIPRGVMHNARTKDESSIHITLGLIGTTYYNFMVSIIKDKLINVEGSRKYLPFGFLNHEDLKKEMEEKLNEILEVLATEDININRDIERVKADRIKNQSNLVLNQLELIDNMLEEKLDIEKSVFRLKQNIITSAKIIGEEYILSANGQEHKFPDYIKPCFDIILNAKAFSQEHLKEYLDEEGISVLFEYLICEGLVEITDTKKSLLKVG
ncbi:cupin domain-containing protein [Mesonia sp. K7]|uniref:cupin domain-containing protein n=1 Tax=Mesonia sp. K7 TaxID=2218606 RepID=UPI000DA7E783|nr:cupin domain-containing protein [Mesonia sp. K7]PZD79308.1 hypothetical protein DNG35_02145 [Mesonia sp. K7]